MCTTADNARAVLWLKARNPETPETSPLSKSPTHWVWQAVRIFDDNQGTSALEAAVRSQNVINLAAAGSSGSSADASESGSSSDA